jgi:hypothetical protein
VNLEIFQVTSTAQDKSTVATYLLKLLRQLEAAAEARLCLCRSLCQADSPPRNAVRLCRTSCTDCNIEGLGRLWSRCKSHLGNAFDEGSRRDQ